MASKRAWRLLGAAIILVGAILLIVALFTPWYAVKTSAETGGSTTVYSYLGMPSMNGTIQFSCSPAAGCPSSTSYPSGTNVGNVVETAFFLLIAGITLGVLATILVFAARDNARRSGFGLALGVLALFLAIITPGFFAVALPPAFSNDGGSSGTNTSGPWSSFMGSSRTPCCNPLNGWLTYDWGPAIGWYLSIVASAILLIGVIILFSRRKESPPTKTIVTPASAAPDPATQPPPSPPPGP